MKNIKLKNFLTTKQINDFFDDLWYDKIIYKDDEGYWLKGNVSWLIDKDNYEFLVSNTDLKHFMGTQKTNAMFWFNEHIEELILKTFQTVFKNRVYFQ